MAIEDLLSALAQRARAQRYGLQTPNTDTSTIMKIAEMNSENANRKALREDARQRVKDTTAAKIAAVNLVEMRKKVDDDSYNYGYRVGLGEDAGEIPKGANLKQVAQGQTAGEGLKNSRATASRMAAKAERDSEAAKLAGQVSQFTAESGGDPRPVIADPAKFSLVPPDKQLAMKKYADILDANDKEDKGDAGLVDFENSLGAAKSVEDVYKTPMPPGVDPTKASTFRNRRIGVLQTEERNSMTQEWREFQQERWTTQDAERKAAIEKGDWKGALASLNTQIDNIASSIKANKDVGGTPRNSAKDATLTARREQLMQEYQALSKKAPGGEAVDPRLKELRGKVKDGSASPEEAEEYLKLTEK